MLARPGTVVRVPVFIRDTSGTPLGVDQPAGSRIQAFSFRITPTPASAIATDGSGNLLVTISAAGLTSPLGAPTFQTTTRTATSFGYVVSYDGTTQAIPFTLGAAAPGNQVAEIAITLASDVPLGTSIALTVDPSSAVTLLSNQAGTTSESVGNGLTVVSGCAVVSQDIPAAGPLALLLLAALLSVAGFFIVRRS